MIRQTKTRRNSLIGMTMRYSMGLIKTERQATYFLFGFVVLAIFVPFFLFSKGESEAVLKAQPGYQIVYPPNEPPRLEPKI